jgi:DNA-binding NarL/FixJ family response regulator
MKWPERLSITNGTAIFKKYIVGRMSKYCIILTEDHVLMRKGIKKIIQENPELAVVGEAGDGLELLQLLEEFTPDMVILDISMPRLQGLEAIKFIKGLYPEIKVLILTMHKDKDYLYRAMDNGADGYILKEDSSDSFHAAIETIRNGKTYISPIIFG